MDHSVSSLSYQGSIVEAITEAKRQKKLLVVYISGDNEESGQLEGSTWKNPTVADSVLKYCILLHLSEGTIDEANFSAIYPQKPAPCITAVGYNGVQLWQIGGFIDAEILASSLQKAWLSLHIQETILTAALASKNSEQQVANNSSSTTFEQGNSSGMNVASPSLATNPESLENSELNAVEIENSTGLNHSDKDLEEMDINIGKMESPGSVSASTLNDGEDVLAASLTERSKASLAPDESDGNNTELGYKAIEDKCDGVVDNCKGNSEVKTRASQVSVDRENEGSRDKYVDVVQEEKLKESETLSKSTEVHLKGNLEVATKTSQVSVDKEPEGSRDKNVDVVQEEKLKESKTLSKPTEVHLNIRLLDGTTLQNKFLLTSTLKMVKQYVDASQASVRSSYDLAIPYPRKVFNDRDLDRTLAELSLFGRQALIVVAPNQGASSSHSQRSSTNYSDSPNSNSEGYFSSVKRILSYINPLSYLGGGASSSNSAQETPGNTWQYGPNPGLRNTVRGSDAASSPNQMNPETGRNKSSKPATLRFGSNIHTLKHDEDDSRTDDKNKFWNGNSTEYGGDSDPK